MPIFSTKTRKITGYAVRDITRVVYAQRRGEIVKGVMFTIGGEGGGVGRHESRQADKGRVGRRVSDRKNKLPNIAVKTVLIMYNIL